ncbi:DUF742 domain-containing protein [Streptomyces pathocidini]|uniref:DUF742 domain-containing protein n=1 Tax=Streptomyces pathocidini TaxID=1650571 RepID=A0ABW7ULW2_9ACTN|nr:DUF742 domain-containing protein [Streptomyces pathocidini]
MATPPSGGYPYGSGQQSHVQGQQPNRFNFPSAPSRQTPPQRRAPAQEQYGRPYEQSYGQPYEPQPYQAPQPPRIQPVQPQPEPSAPQPSSAGMGANPLVRPYAMTGGRTRPRYQLAIEALVHTTAAPAQLQGQLPEHQRICQLCREIKSVAEISALLTIPLGVARILVADLAEAGLVAIHQPGGDETAGGQPDVTLLERVLSGLRKL